MNTEPVQFRREGLLCPAIVLEQRDPIAGDYSSTKKKRVRATHSLVLVAVLATLTACGGGSGNNGTTSPPTVTGLSNQTVQAGQPLAPENLVLTGTGTLNMTTNSSNPTLLPNSGIQMSAGCGASTDSCTLTLTPTAGQTGVTTVTVTATDGLGQSGRGQFTVTINPAPCNHTGVTVKNSVYSFAPLHVSATGRIVDPTGCEVYPVGTNDASPFLGKGGTMGGQWGSVRQALSTNISRVSINTRWWNADVMVPNQGMNYQTWIEYIVHTLEQDGAYVELDATTNFWENPCDGDSDGNNDADGDGDGNGDFCAAEDQGEVDYANAMKSGNQAQIAHYYQGLAVYQPDAVTALQSLAQTFGSDPAVIFDVWNEPADYAFKMLPPNDPNGSNSYLSHMNERIAIINQLAPKSLVVVYEKDPTMQQNGQFYTGNNIVIDLHVYDTNGFDYSQGVPKWVSSSQNWAQSNHAAMIINEYGGQAPTKTDPGWPAFSTYVTALYNFAMATHTGVLYFHGGDLTQSGTQQLPLNDAGNLVAALTQIYFAQ